MALALLQLPFAAGLGTSPSHSKKRLLPNSHSLVLIHLAVLKPGSQTLQTRLDEVGTQKIERVDGNIESLIKRGMTCWNFSTLGIPVEVCRFFTSTQGRTHTALLNFLFSQSNSYRFNCYTLYASIRRRIQISEQIEVKRLDSSSRSM